jgi:Type II secretion system (T2SS), protein E, N-terminal domain
MKYVETPRLLAALGPQALWSLYKCVPVWEDAESMLVVGWKPLEAAAIEDLELMFGKAVEQTGTDKREVLEDLIKKYAANQPISELS